ncbi:hypothetical protein TURU_037648 [Turdus rufiventris]|nr:hypothetical protein TURU_037648 [Turdus rufiventris]
MERKDPCTQDCIFSMNWPAHPPVVCFTLDKVIPPRGSVDASSHSDIIHPKVNKCCVWKDTDLVEQVQRRDSKMIRGMEHLYHNERLKSLRGDVPGEEQQTQLQYGMKEELDKGSGQKDAQPRPVPKVSLFWIQSRTQVSQDGLGS